MKSGAWDAHAAETVDNVKQSFQGKALASAPRHRGRGSSGRWVLSHVVFVLGVILWIELLAWLYVTLMDRDV